MARMINRLSVRSVAALSAKGLYADGMGLYLRVEPTGSRRWIFIFRFRGKRCEMGLGSALSVGLAEAREAAKAARRQVRAGQNPIDEKRRQRASQGLETFGALADQMIADLTPQWRSPVHIRQWVTTLGVDAARLRPLRVGAITTDDVLGVLKPVWLTKPETARKLRGRIEMVLDMARVKGLRQGENPARWKGHLSMLLPRRPALSKKHHPALDYDHLPAFMRVLRQKDCVSALALEFTILTAARSGEARMARIEEFDLVKAVWTVPAERMKRKIPHRVPLSPRAVELVLALQSERQAGPLFRGRRGGPICNMAMANLLPHMDFGKITVHGFRSTFRDWTGDKTGFSREVAEAALHHAVGDSVEQAYRRGDALDLRRQLMDLWGRYCAGDGAQIVALVA